MKDLDILKESICESDFTNKQNLLNIVETVEDNLKNKKYGLVWQNKIEATEEVLKDNFIYLKEVPDRHILKDLKKAQNLLIEGDNLESLTALQYTHKDSVDIIYIDPPYNTGKDFIYCDNFYEKEVVDKNNKYRHSKWLSFMSKRLRLAKNLMKDDAVIFISIDDNEMYQLKLLCDQIFNEENFLNLIVVQSNPGGDKSMYIETTKQYILCYSKNKAYTKSLGCYIDLDASKYTLKDNYGYYKKGSQLEKWGNDDTVHTHPRLAYSIYYNPKTKDVKTLFDYNLEELIENRSLNIIYSSPMKTLIDSGYMCIRPRITNTGKNGRWRVEEKTFLERLKTDEFIFEITNEGLYKVYEKDRLKDKKFEKMKDIILSDIGGQNSELTKMFNDKVFDYPKPVSLIKHLIKNLTSENKNATILDFFAGSGTTGHAILELNKEDGGNRRFILCTNNENDICEKVTYERLSKVINGYNCNQDITKKIYSRKIAFQDFFNNKKTEIIRKEIEDIKLLEMHNFDKLETSFVNNYIYVTGKSKSVEYIEGISSNLRYYKVDYVKKTSNYELDQSNLLEKTSELVQIKENAFDLKSFNNYFSILEGDNTIVGLYIFNYIDSSKLEILLSQLANNKNFNKIAYVPVEDIEEIYNYIDLKYIDLIKFKKIPKELIDIYNKIHKENEGGYF